LTSAFWDRLKPLRPRSVWAFRDESSGDKWDSCLVTNVGISPHRWGRVLCYPLIHVSNINLSESQLF
jgi:hypothetical protein